MGTNPAPILVIVNMWKLYGRAIDVDLRITLPTYYTADFEVVSSDLNNQQYSTISMRSQAANTETP